MYIRRMSLFLQNQNLWENGFHKCLCVKRLEIFHPFANTDELHWYPKFIDNANL
jgi:hypothetical protein